MTQRRQSIIARAIDRTKSFILPEYRYSNTNEKYTVNSTMINKYEAVQSMFEHIKKNGSGHIRITGHTKACLYAIMHLDLLNTDNTIKNLEIDFSVSDEKGGNTGDHKSDELVELLNGITLGHSFGIDLIVDCSANEMCHTSTKVLQLFRDVYKPVLWPFDSVRIKILYLSEKHALDMAGIIKDIKQHPNDVDFIIQFYREDIQFAKRISEFKGEKYQISTDDVHTIEDTYDKVHNILESSSEYYRNDDIVVYFSIGLDCLDRIPHTIKVQ